VGPDALPDSQKLVLMVGELLKEGFLTQSAYDERDSYCAAWRQVALLRIILNLARKGRDMIQAGAPLAELHQLPCVRQIMRAKSTYGNDQAEALKGFEAAVNEELDGLARKYVKHGQVGGGTPV
jgi:V/A-type H+-transporting ATPase subunit A